MPCRDEIPFTVEHRRVIFGAGTLIDPTLYCRAPDSGCCEDDGAGVDPGAGPPCCLGEFLPSIDGTLVAHWTACDTLLFVPITLTWSDILGAYGGESESTDGVVVDMVIWCDDIEAGEWFGVASWYFEGEFVASFEFTLTQSLSEPSVIEGEVIVPSLGCEGDEANTVDISFEYPCIPPETDCCPNTEKSLKFTAISSTGGCACAVGTEVTLDYDSMFGGWQGGGLGVYEPCSYPVNFSVQCTGDGEYTATIAGNSATFTVVSCSPFSAVATATVTTVPPDLLCTGTITWAVEEVDP